jgi:hypothetical protein
MARLRTEMTPHARRVIAAVAAAMLLAASGCAPRPRDRDGNPPGPAGGPGTNWENRPGPSGGTGASPDLRGVYR